MCTVTECWSTTPILLNTEAITIGNNKCNERNHRIDLSKYFNLKSVSIGGACFENQDVLNITGLHSLESVSIGEASFTTQGGWYGNDANRKMFVKNCDRLKELRIKGSFTDYTVIEIENVDKLEVIEIGDLESGSFNFYYASLELRSE